MSGKANPGVGCPTIRNRPQYLPVFSRFVFERSFMCHISLTATCPLAGFSSSYIGQRQHGCRPCECRSERGHGGNLTRPATKPGEYALRVLRHRGAPRSVRGGGTSQASTTEWSRNDDSELILHRRDMGRGPSGMPCLLLL